MQQSAAYNLNNFAIPQVEKKPRIYVAPSTKRRQKLLVGYSRKAIKILLVSVMFLTLIVGVLYMQTTLTELTAQIDRSQSSLVELQSEYTYLSNELEMKTSLKNVEEYATTRLGLVKRDQSQVVYVLRETTSNITKKESWFMRLFGTASETTLSFSEYITPLQ